LGFAWCCNGPRTHREDRVGEAASAAAIEVFAPTLLGYAGVGGLHPDDGPSVGPLADGVERD
jgi:hypothetical protein